jgi:hypothetical protein
MNKLSFKFGLLLGVSLFLLVGCFASAKNIEAQTPTFPLCESQTTNGNPHYYTGLHQIAGDGLLEGKDDVYGLGNSFYFQCFCSQDGRGIQTNWTPVQEGQEWGPDWGLNETDYNYENREYNCGSPVFPLCENQTQNGDQAHYDTGLHQIAGDGLLEGRDDVYSLGKSFFFQCFCSPEGNGIQTNWTPNEAGSEPGLKWGLNNTNYNYENSNYNCGSVIPTPTPTFSQETCTNCGGGSAPVCNDTVPSTPRVLSVTSAGTNSVKITWTKVTQANSYSILYGRKSGEYLYSVFNTGNTDNFVINGITSGCFEVKAVNGCMPGPLSAEFCTGAVLGASTLGNTGAFSDSVNRIILLFGLTLTGLGLIKFAKKGISNDKFAVEASNVYKQGLITDIIITKSTGTMPEAFTLGAIERSPISPNYLTPSSYYSNLNRFADKNSLQKSKIFV